MGFARWIVRGAHVVSMSVLAHLLTVEEFGFVAVAKVLHSLVSMGAFGFSAAVTQKKGQVSQELLNAAWTWDKAVRGCLYSVLLFFCAPSIARLLGAEEALPIARAMSFLPLAIALENNAFVVLSRQLDFRRRFLLEAANGLSMLLTVCTLAPLLQSAWAFVAGLFAGLLARAALSYVLHRHVPRFSWDLRILFELFGFAKWLFALNVLQVAREQLAGIVLSNHLGQTSLATFQNGSRFSNMFASDLTQVARKALFPIYSSVQTDSARITRGYKKSLQFTLLLTFPALGVLAVLAEPLIVLVFSDKWRSSAPVLMWMTLAGALKAITSSIRPLLIGRGTPAHEVLLTSIYLVVLIPLIWHTTRSHGVQGAVWAVVLAEGSLVFPWLWLTTNTLSITLYETAEIVWTPMLLTLPMCAAAWTATYVCNSELLQLFFGGTSSLAAGALIIKVADKTNKPESFQDIKTLVVKMLARNRNREQ